MSRMRAAPNEVNPNPLTSRSKAKVTATAEKELIERL